MYVAVKGGEAAIAATYDLVAQARRGKTDVPELQVAQIREQIALLTAESNACTYCLSAHSALGKLVGLNQAQIDGARHLESSDPRTFAALVFAQAIIDRRGGVSESDIKAVRTAGFSDAEIAEIVAAVALNFFTNFFNRAFDVDVDFPRVEAHNHAAAR